MHPLSVKSTAALIRAACFTTPHGAGRMHQAVQGSCRGAVSACTSSLQRNLTKAPSPQKPVSEPRETEEGKTAASSSLSKIDGEVMLSWN